MSSRQPNESARFDRQSDAERDRLEQENRALRETMKQNDRDRVEYLQNVSHQLVSPLNAIKWHIENLTNNRVTVERGKKVLRSIYSQATLAIHLAKNFALMSNLEGDYALRALREALEPVEVERLLVNLADDYQPLAWDQDITIGGERGVGVMPDVLAMKALISQVCCNIIENAVKYSRRGTTIRIWTEFNSRLDEVSAFVANTGIRLRPEDCNRIFERGFRSQEAQNAYPAGTGFGLYIAQKIVDLHEGCIDASTDKSGETVFRVTLTVRGLEGKARQWDKRPSS